VSKFTFTRTIPRAKQYARGRLHNRAFVSLLVATILAVLGSGGGQTALAVLGLAGLVYLALEALEVRP
jgi:hypothetical protein